MVNATRNDDETREKNIVRGAMDHIDDFYDLAFHKEMECLMANLESAKSHEDGCAVNWDSLLCWPKSPPDVLVQLPCFEELHGIRYDKTQNASRWCLFNGTWDRYSNYTLCKELRGPEIESGVEITTMLYFIGYSASLAALFVAVAIFMYFRELRCLRNSIHTNLMFTYILTDLMWILVTLMQLSMQTDIPTCIILLSLLHYFHLTNFFWMFVEGLYLYLLVVKTFTGNNIKLRFCLAIGWGIPLIVVAIWGIAKSLVDDVRMNATYLMELIEIRTKLISIHSLLFHTLANDFSFENEKNALFRHCPWMVPHVYDWIYQVPAIMVLGVNVVFLFAIMWVLITKLRSANNVETQQYRKASKALLVLIPLLGVTYILVLAGPTEGRVANVFSYARAILLSSQGLSVALFYCFLNSEVQNTMRHHFSRWTTARNLRTDRKYYNNSSPRSRTESIRLNCQPSNTYRKRESTISETTSTTMVGPNSTTALIDRTKPVISEDANE